MIDVGKAMRIQRKLGAERRARREQTVDLIRSRERVASEAEVIVVDGEIIVEPLPAPDVDWRSRAAWLTALGPAVLLVVALSMRTAGQEMAWDMARSGFGIRVVMFTFAMVGFGVTLAAGVLRREVRRFSAVDNVDASTWRWTSVALWVGGVSGALAGIVAGLRFVLA